VTDDGSSAMPVGRARTTAPDGDVIDTSSVIVCCGSGGVGKTTTAAVLGLEAAHRGRKAVVVTIDPARRLADALGLEGGLASEPQRIDLGGGFGDGAPDGSGELWAMMLDTAATFDGLVRRHADSDEQIERILTNPLYRNIAGALSGTQEYMAAETLHDLHGDERFDLVVVDTPPSRNALDFLEAPGVLARFLDHRVFRLLMLPTKGGLKVLGTATQPILKAIGKVVGSDVLSDSVAFFQAFAGMETGFRERATDVMALIRAPATSFVVVASPRRDTIDEAVWFANQLVDQGVGVDAAIVNRTHPAFGHGDAADAVREADAARGGPASGEEGSGEGVLAALWDNVAELRTARELELDVIAPLADIVGVDRLVVLPLLDADVHDLDGLLVIAAHLFDHPGADG
jgi:anion-transporting  ArsA/GET3 family ATPase